VRRGRRSLARPRTQVRATAKNRDSTPTSLSKFARKKGREREREREEHTWVEKHGSVLATRETNHGEYRGVARGAAVTRRFVERSSTLPGARAIIPN